VRVEVVLSSLLYDNYKDQIFPLVLYGCETWSPTIREEHKLRVFGGRVLMKIFGPKREEVSQGWSKL
jgi:hypothetical protein